MNCQRVEQRLSNYLEGLLAERDAAAVAAHLRDCAACRRYRHELVAFEDEVRAIAHGQPAPHPDLRRRAVDLWMAERSAPIPRAPGWLLGLSQPAPARLASMKLFSVVTALLLLLVALLLARWDHTRSQGANRPSIVQRSAPGQIGLAPRPPSRLSPPGFRTRGGKSGSVPRNPRGRDDEQFVLRPTRGMSEQQRGSRPLALGSRPRAPAQDDLAYVNGDPVVGSAMWRALSLAERDTIEKTVCRTVRVRDDFVQIPFPRLVDASNAQVVAAVESYKREAAIVDARLSREVTLAFKATALSDLCDRLRADTGIRLEAGASVADEKVTLFCEKLPLREVMRQLARPFGYTWSRSGKEGEYRYELLQDLRSQLLEEELRNRDRNAALLALDDEMSRYRPYLSLSPDEALARAQTAAPEAKKLLERLAGRAWGPIQIYFRLSRDDLAALRSGQALIFSEEPKPGEQALPPGLARGVIQDLREVRLIKKEEGYDFAGKANPGAVPLTAVPEARSGVKLSLTVSELGQFALEGSSRFKTVIMAHESAGGGFSDGRPLALGICPAVLRPENAQANANLAHDPSLRLRVTVHPAPSSLLPAPQLATAPAPGSETDGDAKVTSADVLEALHRTTGMPIVADYYTRLNLLREVSAQSQTLFDALNHVADAMRLRWAKEGPWLQFRSTSFYDDRVKEVPNRLLNRWAEERRRHGMLSLEALIEIAGLSDAQLDASDMAEGARLCWGLLEWDLARSRSARADWRFLSQLTPSQRQEAQSATGLPFNRMSPAQQQQFVAVAAGSGDGGLPSLAELGGATFRVVYTQPGGFEWPGLGHPTVLQFRPSPVYERTREAALQQSRRFSSQVTEAQIVPTELAVTVLYSCGAQSGAYVRVSRTTPKEGTNSYDGRPRPVADRN